MNRAACSARQEDGPGVRRLSLSLCPIGRSGGETQGVTLIMLQTAVVVRVGPDSAATMAASRKRTVQGSRRRREYTSTVARPNADQVNRSLRRATSASDTRSPVRTICPTRAEAASRSVGSTR